MITAQDANRMAREISAVGSAARLEETLWVNLDAAPFESVRAGLRFSADDIRDAAERLARFAPFLRAAFPETADAGGAVASPLAAIGGMKALLDGQGAIPGRLLLKMDSHLPIAGSVKARGGVYEVLKHAEELALAHGMLKPSEDYGKLASPELRQFFSRFTVQVGSTGNLGMSIGITSRALGFRAVVHMSADARQWKKDLLRQRGATVIEYSADYSDAVARGRAASLADPMSYFVDDEQSSSLFLGYATAASELRRQLQSMGIAVDREHPLFAYLPCGIGGAPGGIAFGLKHAFGDDAHCFFVEPTHACCFLLGMATGLHDGVSVQDFGIDGVTNADGLAVSRPSALVGRLVRPLISGCMTVSDSRMEQWMKLLYRSEGIFIEPSACASFGAWRHCEALLRYAAEKGIQDAMPHATHVAWATGGSLAPEAVQARYLNG